MALPGNDPVNARTYLRTLTASSFSLSPSPSPSPQRELLKGQRVLYCGLPPPVRRHTHFRFSIRSLFVEDKNGTRAIRHQTTVAPASSSTAPFEHTPYPYTMAGHDSTVGVDYWGLSRGERGSVGGGEGWQGVEVATSEQATRAVLKKLNRSVRSE